MPTIRISPDFSKNMSKADFEEYLIGSGKPAGAEFTVKDSEVSWGGPPASTIPVPPPPPMPMPSSDYANMTKVELESHVRDTHGVELDRRKKLSTLIVEAEQLDKQL